MRIKYNNRVLRFIAHPIACTSLVIVIYVTGAWAWSRVNVTGPNPMFCGESGELKAHVRNHKWEPNQGGGTTVGVDWSIPSGSMPYNGSFGGSSTVSTGTDVSGFAIVSYDAPPNTGSSSKTGYVTIMAATGAPAHGGFGIDVNSKPPDPPLGPSDKQFQEYLDMVKRYLRTGAGGGADGKLIDLLDDMDENCDTDEVTYNSSLDPDYLGQHTCISGGDPCYSIEFGEGALTDLQTFIFVLIHEGIHVQSADLTGCGAGSFTDSDGDGFPNDFDESPFTANATGTDPSYTDEDAFANNFASDHTFTADLCG